MKKPKVDWILLFLSLVMLVMMVISMTPMTAWCRNHVMPSGLIFFLRLFIWLSFFLTSILCSRDAELGFVATLFFIFFNPCSISSFIRRITSVLFCNWDREDCDLTWSHPSELIRFFSLVPNKIFWFLFRRMERSMWKSPSTMVSTLFTFWPPLPPLRAVLNSISLETSIFIV